MPKFKTDREAILHKSLQIFRERGYYNTSLSDLSVACNIEKAHFYYYFKSKKDLMHEILQYVQQIVKEQILNYSFDESKTPEDRIKLITTNIGVFHPNLDLGCLMGNTVLETIGNKEGFENQLKSYFLDWINSLKNLYISRYDEKTAEMHAMEDLQCLQGAIMMMRLYRDRNILENALDKMKKRLIN